MDEEIKSRWVAALRSGDYQQGTNSLHSFNADREQFCCLGVLCDLAYKDGVVERTMVRSGLVHRYHYGTEEKGSRTYLPEEVSKWAGITTWNPVVTLKQVDNSLATLNDGGMTFRQIAELIDQQF